MKYIILTILFAILTLHCLSQNLIPFNVDTSWGYKDRQGNTRISPQYQYAGRFRMNTAIVIKDELAAAIDTNNHLVIPFKYEFLEQLDSSEFLFGYRAIYFGDYNMGVMTRDQKIKILPEYRYISKYNGYYLVKKQEDSIMGETAIGTVRTFKSIYGLIDSNGKIVIPCKFNYISWINDSLLVVQSGVQGINNALYNKKGEQLTSFEYMVFGKFIDGLAKARIGNKYGFISPNGKVAIPISFDYCEEFSNGHAIIKEKDKWGAINKEGKIIIEPKFDYQEVKNLLKEKYSNS